MFYSYNYAPKKLSLNKYYKKCYLTIVFENKDYDISGKFTPRTVLQRFINKYKLFEENASFFVSASAYAPMINRPLGIIGWMTVSQAVNNMFDILDNVDLRNGVVKFSFSSVDIDLGHEVYMLAVDKMMHATKHYKTTPEFQDKRRIMLNIASYKTMLRFRRYNVE